ncbi:hypothetical protein ASZ90_004692 [hydrocarbon metagenome]|uniref:Uncharacterized protein n=1 Tax=hydrocarbon metagenome TaxID=938273 RepID=A0A0W8FXJ8_9ZZZZ
MIKIKIKSKIKNIYNSIPVNFSNASLYFALVLLITSSGNFGGGGCLLKLIDNR